MTDTPRLLGISGSLRAQSFNSAILASLGRTLGDRASFTVFPLNDVPLYDQDADTDTPPPAVAALRAAIGDADGIVIASPEYNYGMSGVLKNALDWASRPYGKAKLTGKPVLTITSSPAATGGVRAQSGLNEVVTAIGARLVLGPQAVVTAVHEKVKDGAIADEATRDFLIGRVDALLADIRVPNSSDREA